MMQDFEKSFGVPKVQRRVEPPQGLGRVRQRKALENSEVEK
jgi:hypothetical protein